MNEIVTTITSRDFSNKNSSVCGVLRNRILQLLVLISLLNMDVLGQPGNLDLSFNPGDLGFGNGDGPNNFVSTTAILSDGRIIMGGNFTSYNGTAINYIARLNS